MPQWLHFSNKSFSCGLCPHHQKDTPTLFQTETLKLNLKHFCISVQWDAIFRTKNGSKFTVHTNMNPNIGLLRLFPGITAETVSRLKLNSLERSSVLKISADLFRFVLIR